MNLPNQDSRLSRDSSRKRQSIFDESNRGSARPHYDKVYSNNRQSATHEPTIDHTTSKTSSCPNAVFVVLGLFALAGLVTLFVLAVLNPAGPGNLTSFNDENDVENGETEAAPEAEKTEANQPSEGDTIPPPEEG